MKILRQNNNWLSYRASIEIKKNHGDILDNKKNTYKEYFFKFLSNDKNWWIHILIVLIIFSINTIDIPCLNFIYLYYQNAISILEQRISNLTTITSITLVIFNLLITNLSEKKPIIFNLIFKKSYFYPILYFNLCTIGSLILISLLKDTISSFIYVKLTVSGSYLIIFSLFLIGYLFRYILIYSNNSSIYSILEEELIKEYKQFATYSLIRIYSKNSFEEFMKEKNIEPFSLSSFFENIDPQNISINPSISSTNHTPTIKYLTDVNLKKISKFLKKSREDYEFNLIELHSDMSLEYLYLRNKNRIHDTTEENELINCLVFEKKTTKDDFTTHFNKSLKENFEKSNYSEIKKILESFSEVYSIESKIITENISSNTTISNIDSSIRELFKLSFKKNDIECLILLRDLLYNITDNSIKNNNTTLFNVYIKHFMFFDSEELKKSNHILFENYQIEFINYLIKISDSDIPFYKTGKTEAELLDYYKTCFETINSVVYSLIKHPVENKNTLNLILKRLTQSTTQSIPYTFKSYTEDANDINHKIYNYKRRIQLGIRFWFWFLYKENHIENYRDIDNIVSLTYQRNIPSDFISDLYFILNLEVDIFLEWNTWKLNEGIFFSTPSNWFLFGFIIEYTKNNYSLPIDLDKDIFKQDIETLDTINKRVSIQIEHLKEDYLKWKEILSIESESFFIEKLNQLEMTFKSYLDTKKLQRQIDITKSQIEEPLIKNFTEKIKNILNKKAYIHNIFYKQKNYKLQSKITNLPKKISQQIDKTVFISKYNKEIFNPTFIVETLAYNDKTSFYNLALGDKTKTTKGDTLINIKKLRKKIQEKGFKPSHVFICQTLYYTDTSLRTHPSFTSISEPEITNKVGEFEGMEIFCEYIKEKSNFIVLCDFAKAFEMICLNDSQYLGDKISIEIKETEESKLNHQNYNTEPLKVLITIQENKTYKIIDKNAFTVVLLENQLFL